MKDIKYLKWMTANTCTKWWCDSAVPEDIELGIENGATGITTNPPLVAASLAKMPDFWAPKVYYPKDMEAGERVQETIKCVTQHCAKLVELAYLQSKGAQGYACAQVDPRKPGNSSYMLETAKSITKWAPNIAVKLPVTAAGLDALEECAALGITVTATVSFTLPQVLAVAERYQQGIMRAKKAGITPGRCFAVVMVGRIDDYIRDVAEDSGAAVYESDIRQCGSAIMKRAYSIYKEKGYDAVLMAAGMRGAYHATDLAGADMTLSIHPKIQAMISGLTEPFEEHIDIPVDKDVINRLIKIPEFVRAYEPDGMKPSEFITYGVVQKTLAQFIETGWAPIEAFSKSKGAAK